MTSYRVVFTEDSSEMFIEMIELHSHNNKTLS